MQSQVTFIIDSMPDYTPEDSEIYIAGNFNSWNPGNPDFMLQKNEQDKYSITLEAQNEGSTLEFKFTRGSWDNVEKGPAGEEIPNRSFVFGNGETVEIIIYNWADFGGGNHTAADNVHILSEDFFMPQFNRDRRIWIYLPPDYETSQKNYPVIYMHDGQNLFDEATSFLGVEWKVDETLNTLAEESVEVPIVIGIDNGGLYRIDEYTPWANPTYGGGQGKLYTDFIIETLKLFVDENYRTLKERENTAIWGSSLGGLISFYAGLKYQDIFSKIGVFSPSFWFSDSVYLFAEEMGKQQDMRIFLMAGDQESGATVHDMQAMYDTLLNVGFTTDELNIKVVPNGQHNEFLWQQEFRETYLWLFNFFAYAIEEFYFSDEIFVYPNPVTDVLIFPSDLKVNDISKIEVFNSSGCKVIDIDSISDRKINVNHLPDGIYFVKLSGNSNFFQAKFIKK